MEIFVFFMQTVDNFLRKKVIQLIHSIIRINSNDDLN